MGINVLIKFKEAILKYWTFDVVSISKLEIKTGQNFYILNRFSLKTCYILSKANIFRLSSE